MSAKELKIEAPEGYEIDWENSSNNVIRFKPIKKKITYKDVKEKLFSDKEHYVEYSGTINSSKTTRYFGENIIIATSIQQIEQLLALNKLMNVAKYLNGDWKPDFTNRNQNKWYIYYDFEDLKWCIGICAYFRYFSVYFKSKELALQVIEILGEDEVKKALGIFE
jgi:hypothetical protein